jgi:hypothetical protein
MESDEAKSGEKISTERPAGPRRSEKAIADAADRRARLAEELRRNLLRRKSQKRGRQEQASDE